MSRVQLALRVGDLEGSIAFYSRLFNTEPAKRRPGYANFVIAEPPLKLVLLEGDADQTTVMDHLGVEVETTELVNAATTRLSGEGLATLTEDNTTCCYAVQDKVWVHGPGQEPWEVYTVRDDSPTFARERPLAEDESACCTGDLPVGAIAGAVTVTLPAARPSTPGPPDLLR